MDKVVQRSAANADENAAASGEMNAQAAQMQVFVQDLSAIVGSNGKKGKRAHRGPMEANANRTKAP